MYKLRKIIYSDNSFIEDILFTNDSKSFSIPFDPANTDYANFKKEILADEAQLQDADGNTMTPEQAKTYVATLP
jgi:hypothetical protein